MTNGVKWKSTLDQRRPGARVCVQRSSRQKRHLESPCRRSNCSSWRKSRRRRSGGSRSPRGPDKAIYAYAVEDLRWWEEKLGRSLPYGQFGENLTTEGIEVNNALIGERWEIGSTVLEVSEPRVPCWRLGVRMEDQMFPRRFTEALRPGAYLRIIVEGNVGAGDDLQTTSRSNDPGFFPHLHPRPR